MPSENIVFKNRDELLKYLNISQATFYRKARRNGLITKKLSFTKKELSELKKYSHADNFDSDKSNKTEIYSQNSQYIITLENELKEKNQQLLNAQKLLERSQQLQLIAEQRWTETNRTLIEYQKNENNTKKGFWSRIFGYKQ